MTRRTSSAASPIWTKDEDSILLSEYRESGAAGLLQRLPGRSVRAIDQHARVLGLGIVTRPCKQWMDEEIKIIRENYPKGGSRACLAKLPGRSPAAIRKCAIRLRLTYTKPDELSLASVSASPAITAANFEERRANLLAEYHSLQREIYELQNKAARVSREYALLLQSRARDINHQRKVA